MKLHLPKALFTAVMALFAISPAAYALTVDIDRTYTYDSFATDGTATVLPDGVTYDATTGVLTGMDSKNLYFTLDMDALTAANANQHVVYITNDSAASWGINTTEEGTNLTGFWFQRISETNPAGNWTDAGNANLSVLTPDEDNEVVVKASMGSGVGTYLYTLDGDAAYSAGSLRTGGTITTLTVNNTFVSSILYNVQSTVNGIEISNADGTFTRSYTDADVSIQALPSADSGVQATIINNGTLQVTGQAGTEKKIETGSDIIIGGSGQLFLQTWNGNNGVRDADILVNDDIYLGSTSNGSGALRTADYCGDVIFNGDITLIEDALYTKEEQASDGEHGTNTIINGKLSGDYTLSVKSNNENKDFNDILFAGEIDLKGLNFMANGTGSADVTISGQTAIDKVTVNADTTITKSGSNSMTFGAEGASADTDALVINQKLELAGSGVINVNGAIRGNNSVHGEFIVGQDITVNADMFHASWSMPTIQIDGVLKVDTFNLSTDSKVSNVSGAGKIQAGSFNMGNTGTYNVNEVRVEVGAGGVKTTANGAYHTVYLGDATFAATTESWTWNTGKDVALADETTGTTFEVADGKTITMDNRLVDKVVSVTTGEGDEATTTEVTTAGKLIKTGLGTLLLNTNNTYTGDTSVKAGTLEIAANKSMGSTAITVDTDAKLVLNAGTYSNVISGDGKLEKKGDGTLTIGSSTANTYTGGTTIEGGTVIAAATGALGSGPVDVKNGSTLDFSHQGHETGISAINLSGGSNLIVRSGYWAQNFESAILIDGDNTITSGYGGNDGKFKGSIQGAGTLKLDQCLHGGNPTGDTWAIESTVADKDGALAIESTANVTMKGNNTYTGGTTIKSKTMKTDNVNALGAGTVTVDGGTLELASALKVSELEYKSGTLSNAGNALEAGKLTVAAGTKLTDAGAGSVTVTDTLTVSSTDAFQLGGELVLTGATVDLSGFTLDTSTAQDEYVYTLGTAAGGITADASISFSGLNLDGYTATLVAQATDPNSPIALLAESNNYLVLTLTKDQEPVTPPPATEQLTKVNVAGGSWDDASKVLTLTTVEKLADFSGLGTNLNAVIADELWVELTQNVGTLVDVSFVDAEGNIFDFDGVDGSTPVNVTLNGVGTNNVPTVYGNEGTVVGSYMTSYIPEPTSTTLSLLALAALAVRRRRR